MNLKALQGAIEQVDAAGKTGKTDGLEDVARVLRDELADVLKSMYDDHEALVTNLSALASDSPHAQAGRNSLEAWQTNMGAFAPRLGDDPYRPNPITQPADPNPVDAPGPVPTPGDDADPADLQGDDLDAALTSAGIDFSKGGSLQDGSMSAQEKREALEKSRAKA